MNNNQSDNNENEVQTYKASRVNLNTGISNPSININDTMNINIQNMNNKGSAGNIMPSNKIPEVPIGDNKKDNIDSNKSNNIEENKIQEKKTKSKTSQIIKISVLVVVIILIIILFIPIILNSLNY